MKKVTARKDHDCSCCTNGIKAGEQYYHESHKVPTFDDRENPDKQTGIEYLKGKYCQTCHDNVLLTPECDEHDLEPEYEFDGYVSCHRVCIPTGNLICKTCGFVAVQ